jgi:probable rRNA maturation factor
LIVITILNHQKLLRLDRPRMRRAAKAILGNAGIRDAQISIAIVDDPTIAKLHDQFLNDPTPTDVLSFLLERSERRLEGEVVVSAETAIAAAPKFRQTPEDELLRYVIHGMLHLIGYDDAARQSRNVMRKREEWYLSQSYNPPTT